LENAQLADFVRSLKDGLDTVIGELGMRVSGGQRQRIGIARALYRDPEILFFDEATSALDHETEQAVMDAIHTLGNSKTMLLVAHRLTTIEACDKIFRVENGRVEETTL
jgi:ABC-type multidrug transport system fused ATPase/permease subunit